MISPQAALVYAMVVAAQAEAEIDDAEIAALGDLVGHLPIFKGIDRPVITAMAVVCSELLSRPGGRAHVLATIKDALPARLRATAYALACEIIALDVRARRQGSALSEEIRAALEVDALTAHAIERAAQVRFQAA